MARSETFQMSSDWAPERRRRRSLPQSKNVAAPTFTRLLLVQLIFLVTVRSRSHGRAP